MWLNEDSREKRKGKRNAKKKGKKQRNVGKRKKNVVKADEIVHEVVAGNVVGEADLVVGVEIGTNIKLLVLLVLRLLHLKEWQL